MNRIFLVAIMVALLAPAAFAATVTVNYSRNYTTIGLVTGLNTGFSLGQPGTVLNDGSQSNYTWHRENFAMLSNTLVRTDFNPTAARCSGTPAHAPSWRGNGGCSATGNYQNMSSMQLQIEMGANGTFPKTIWLQRASNIGVWGNNSNASVCTTLNTCPVTNMSNWQKATKSYLANITKNGTYASGIYAIELSNEPNLANFYANSYASRADATLFGFLSAEVNASYDAIVELYTSWNKTGDQFPILCAPSPADGSRGVEWIGNWSLIYNSSTSRPLKPTANSTHPAYILCHHEYSGATELSGRRFNYTWTRLNEVRDYCIPSMQDVCAHQIVSETNWGAGGGSNAPLSYGNNQYAMLMAASSWPRGKVWGVITYAADDLRASGCDSWFGTCEGDNYERRLQFNKTVDFNVMHPIGSSVYNASADKPFIYTICSRNASNYSCSVLNNETTAQAITLSFPGFTNITNATNYENGSVYAASGSSIAVGTLAPGTIGRYALGFTSADIGPPNISNVLTNNTNAFIQVNWSCDEACNASVAYSPTSSPDSYATTTAFQSSHSINISGLTNPFYRTYYLNITVCDSIGNCRTNATFAVVLGPINGPAGLLEQIMNTSIPKFLSDQRLSNATSPCYGSFDSTTACPGTVNTRKSEVARGLITLVNNSNLTNVVGNATILNRSLLGLDFLGLAQKSDGYWVQNDPDVEEDSTFNQPASFFTSRAYTEAAYVMSTSLNSSWGNRTYRIDAGATWDNDTGSRQGYMEAGNQGNRWGARIGTGSNTARCTNNSGQAYANAGVYGWVTDTDVDIYVTYEYDDNLTGTVTVKNQNHTGAGTYGTIGTISLANDATRKNATFKMVNPRATNGERVPFSVQGVSGFCVTNIYLAIDRHDEAVQVVKKAAEYTSERRLDCSSDAQYWKCEVNTSMNTPGGELAQLGIANLMFPNATYQLAISALLGNMSQTLRVHNNSATERNDEMRSQNPNDPIESTQLGWSGTYHPVWAENTGAYYRYTRDARALSLLQNSSEFVQYMIVPLNSSHLMIQDSPSSRRDRIQFVYPDETKLMLLSAMCIVANSTNAAGAIVEEATERLVYYNYSSAFSDPDEQYDYVTLIDSMIDCKGKETYSSSYTLPYENTSTQMQVFDGIGITFVRTPYYAAWMGSKGATPAGGVIASVIDTVHQVPVISGLGAEDSPASRDYALGRVIAVNDNTASNAFDTQSTILIHSTNPPSLTFLGLLRKTNYDTLPVSYQTTYRFYPTYIAISQVTSNTTIAQVGPCSVETVPNTTLESNIPYVYDNITVVGSGSWNITNVDETSTWCTVDRYQRQGTSHQYAFFPVRNYSNVFEDPNGRKLGVELATSLQFNASENSTRNVTGIDYVNLANVTWRTTMQTSFTPTTITMLSANGALNVTVYNRSATTGSLNLTIPILYSQLVNTLMLDLRECPNFFIANRYPLYCTAQGCAYSSLAVCPAAFNRSATANYTCTGVSCT